MNSIVKKLKILPMDLDLARDFEFWTILKKNRPLLVKYIIVIQSAE